MSVKALFLDVDGTLVSFRTHAVPASTREALARVRARGIRLFIATGRTVVNLTPLAGIAYDGVVSVNGARTLLGDGRVVGLHPIPRAAFERALSLSEACGFSIALELESGIFVNRRSPAVEELARLVALSVPPECDLRAVFDRSECCQMCFYFDEATERRVMPELPELTAARWYPFFADVNARGVNKAVGMADLASYYGFGLEETMAFGDGGNDAEMLRAAGIGVAMGNACDEAKEAADYVTADIDDDGLLRALEHFGVL